MSIDKVLGKITEYPQTYDPSILVRELRQTNRDSVNLDGDNLPFIGFDTWNAYEVSALTNTGVPVVGVCKIVYNCDSKYIVESKSLKLYFNSFNMDRVGKDPRDVRHVISKTATIDLSKLLETEVKVVMFPSYTAVAPVPVRVTTGQKDLDEFYLTLEEEFLPEKSDVYTETPSLLTVASREPGAGAKTVTKKYHSALLKSNCKVTSQPDWGDIYISITGEVQPEPSSLLKYIISFRDECHFHEEICETVYQRLNTIYQPSGLEVTCLYARRGGIDINPTRVSSADLLPQDLIEVTKMHFKTIKQ